MNMQKTLYPTEIIANQSNEELKNFSAPSKNKDWITGTTYQQVCGVFDIVLGQTGGLVNRKKT